MPWIRVDDHFDEHPKLAASGPLAWALWLAGLAYCNRNLTDGFIPWSIAGRLVSWDYLDAGGANRIYIGTRDSVSEEGAVESGYVIGLLLNAGLWTEEAGGYRVHDFDQYQPTKATIMAERAKKVAAGSAGGIATATARAKAGAVAEVQPVPKPVPNSQSHSENARDNDPYADGEGEALTWLAKHGCDIRPGNGYHQKLVVAVEQHGSNAVIGMFDRLAAAGTKQGDVKGFLFGAIDALNARTRPNVRLLEAEEREDERRESFAERAARTRQRNAELAKAIEATSPKGTA